jgi:hypothetical protein
MLASLLSGTSSCTDAKLRMNGIGDKMRISLQEFRYEEEAVAPCTRDYVATNGWLSKGCNRLTSGTARNPCFKKAQIFTLSVPSTLRTDGIGMRVTRE